MTTYDTGETAPVKVAFPVFPAPRVNEHDIDLIDIMLAAGPLRPNPFQYDACVWCHHEWHGVTCKRCHCDCSDDRLDDTWRVWGCGTLAEQARRIMHDTGCDGWTACYAAGLLPRPGRASLTLRLWLYGPRR